MTRAEVAQMFFNLLLERGIETTKTFSDIDEGAWFEQAVNALASLGVLSGYADGTFQPEGPITRAEFVTVAARFAKSLPEVSEPVAFNDVPDSHWAHDYIYAAAQFGWISGYADGSFQPNQSITRAEAVVIVNRMLGRVADREYIDDHPTLERFDDVPQTHWAYYDIMEAFDAHEYEGHDEGGIHEHWQ